MSDYTPFKMKGHSLPGPNQRKSPVKQGRNMGILGFQPAGSLEKYKGLVDTENIFKKGEKMKAITSLTPKVKLNEKLTIGGKISGSSAGVMAVPTTKGHSQTSLTGKYKLGGDTGPRGLHSGFQGSISGDVGVRNLFSKKGSGFDKKKGKLTYGGKVSLGGGTKKSNIKAFGEHTSKDHLSGGGTKVGVEGKLGVFKGSAGYNLKTKKPEFKLGITL